MYQEFICCSIAIKTKQIEIYKIDADESQRIEWTPGNGFMFITGRIGNWNNGKFNRTKIETLAKSQLDEYIRDFEEAFLSTWSGTNLFVEINQILDRLDNIEGRL